MQVSTKRDDREEFLNGLRVRLNVDEQTLSHLEMRMSGKSIFLFSAQATRKPRSRFCVPEGSGACVERTVAGRRARTRRVSFIPAQVTDLLITS